MDRGCCAAVLASVLSTTALIAAAEVDPLVAPLEASVPPPSVSFADGSLSVEADDVPLDELLQAIATESGVEIRGAVLDPRPVTIRLDGVPLREAVDRLLRRQNFTMRYRGDGSLRWIMLRGPSLAVEPGRRALVQDLAPLVARAFIDVPPGLQPRFGAARVRLSRFLRTAGRLPEAGVRQVCLRLFLNAVQRDPAMRSGLRAMTVQRLDQFARRHLAGRGIELVQLLSTQAVDRGVRARATMAARWVGSSMGS